MKSRVADTLLLTSLRWTAEMVLQVAEDSSSVYPPSTEAVAEQLDALRDLLDVEPVASSSAVPPAHSDIAAVRGEGHPWNVVAPLANRLLDLDEGDLVRLAVALLIPDEQMWWRLFHLAILGELLIAARSVGMTFVSHRPLPLGTVPAYTALDRAGRQWDLWFEAAAAWNHYGITPPYRLATAGVPGTGGAIGADLLLVRRSGRALILECKYSRDPDYIGRQGYQQALAYAVEVRTHLATEVTAVVVAPEGVVTGGMAETAVGDVRVVPPSALSTLVERLLNDD